MTPLQCISAFWNPCLVSGWSQGLLEFLITGTKCYFTCGRPIACHPDALPLLLHAMASPHPIKQQKVTQRGPSLLLCCRSLQTLRWWQILMSVSALFSHCCVFSFQAFSIETTVSRPEWAVCVVAFMRPRAHRATVKHRKLHLKRYFSLPSLSFWREGWRLTLQSNH